MTVHRCILVTRPLYIRHIKNIHLYVYISTKNLCIVFPMINLNELHKNEKQNEKKQ